MWRAQGSVHAPPQALPPAPLSTKASLTIALFVVASSALSTQSWWGSRPHLYKGLGGARPEIFPSPFAPPSPQLRTARVSCFSRWKHTLGVLGGSHLSLYSPHIKRAVKCPQVPWGRKCPQEPLLLGIMYMPCLESFSLNSSYIRRQAALRREV